MPVKLLWRGFTPLLPKRRLLHWKSGYVQFAVMSMTRPRVIRRTAFLPEQHLKICLTTGFVPSAASAKICLKKNRENGSPDRESRFLFTRLMNLYSRRHTHGEIGIRFHAMFTHVEPLFFFRHRNTQPHSRLQCFKQNQCCNYRPGGHCQHTQ